MQSFQKVLLVINPLVVCHCNYNQARGIFPATEHHHRYVYAINLGRQFIMPTESSTVDGTAYMQFIRYNSGTKIQKLNSINNTIAATSGVNNKLQSYDVCVNSQVFVAWCSYVDSRRRKAARYSRAIDTYRRRLLTEGATKWLRVSSDLSQLRMRHATQEGVQVIIM